MTDARDLPMDRELSFLSQENREKIESFGALMRPGNHVEAGKKGLEQDCTETKGGVRRLTQSRHSAVGPVIVPLPTT